MKRNFKEAEHYFSSWYYKNDSQEKMELEMIDKIKVSEEDLLLYYTYKILIHFEYISKIRI